MTDLHQPVLPVPELPAWSEQLRQLSRQPLEFCPELPEIARRCEAWWAHDCLDRPVFTAGVNLNPARPITRRYELLHDPDEWFEAKFADMRQIRRLGDALPAIRVGVPVLSSMFESKFEFSQDTAWTWPTIQDDWSNAPSWQFREDDPYLALFRKLLRRVSQDARGRYLVCSPGVGPAGDLLMTMRGSEQLCLDLITQPERVLSAINTIYPAWRRFFQETYRIPLEEGAGVILYLGFWSNRPYDVTQCDFSYMIGPHHFRQLFAPEIARIAATMSRTIFHLDGPGVARHLDAILEIPDIQAIQWVPGDGAPSPLPWIEMLKKIQRRGRSLQVVCPARDVLPLCEALRPEGLAIWCTGGLPPTEMDDLFARFCKMYA
jgi:hypothetical protein